MTRNVAQVHSWQWMLLSTALWSGFSTGTEVTSHGTSPGEKPVNTESHQVCPCPDSRPCSEGDSSICSDQTLFGLLAESLKSLPGVELVSSPGPGLQARVIPSAPCRHRELANKSTWLCFTGDHEKASMNGLSSALTRRQWEFCHAERPWPAPLLPVPGNGISASAF